MTDCLKAHGNKGRKRPDLAEYNRTRINPMKGRKGKEHPMFGYQYSEEQLAEMRKRNKGEGNPMYNKIKDNPTLLAIHLYIKRRLPKPELCQLCNIIPPYDLANVSGKYLRDLDDWLYLCRKCHMDSDGRLINFMKHRNNEKKHG